MDSTHDQIVTKVARRRRLHVLGYGSAVAVVLVVVGVIQMLR